MRTRLRSWAAAAMVVVALSAAGSVCADDLADQTGVLGKSMREALDRYRPKWTQYQRLRYVRACERLLRWYFAEPLKPEEVEILQAGQRNWVRESLPPDVSNEYFAQHVNGLDYAVSLMAQRPHLRPTEEEQEEIDRQIDLFCEMLEPALVEHFGDRSTKHDLAYAVASIRASFKRLSRNPWFPGLKEPLDYEKESNIESQIIEWPLASQRQSFDEAERDGKKLTFDWGVTSAWSAATKFVSKTVNPPADRTLTVSHSPSMPNIGIQVAPPMMATARPTGLRTPPRRSPIPAAGCPEVAPTEGSDQAADLAGQIGVLGLGMRDALDQDQPYWTDHQRAAYVGACCRALDKYLAEPLSPEALEAVRGGQRGWVRDCLPLTVWDEHMDWYLSALDYAVSEMLRRPQATPSESEQEKMDEQIDFFCDRLRAALPLYFRKHTTESAMAEAVDDIHTCLRANSRNPWFPALKEPLGPEEIEDVRKRLHQTLALQVRSFAQAKAEGATMAFDWAVTCAWAAATEFVVKTTEPPTDRMVQFGHSPSGLVLGVQVRPFMMGPEEED